MTEVPWDNTTQTPQHNPLEKLPVLIDTEASDDDAVYESHFILEWIEFKFPPPEYVALIPQNKERELFAKKVQGESSSLSHPLPPLLSNLPTARYIAAHCTPSHTFLTITT